MGGNNQKAWNTRRKRHGEGGATPEGLKAMSEGGKRGGQLSPANFKNDKKRAAAAGSKGGKAERKAVHNR